MKQMLWYTQDTKDKKLNVHPFWCSLCETLRLCVNSLYCLQPSGNTELFYKLLKFATSDLYAARQNYLLIQEQHTPGYRTKSCASV
jgi:hypothetical protein